MKEITTFCLAVALAVYGRAVDIMDDFMPGQRLEFSIRRRKPWNGGDYLKILD